MKYYFYVFFIIPTQIIVHSYHSYIIYYDLISEKESIVFREISCAKYGLRWQDCTHS